MKTLFLMVLLVSPSLPAGTPAEAPEIRLKSVEEKTYTPNGQAFGDVHQIVFTWECLAQGEPETRKKFVLEARRRLAPEREELRCWETWIDAVTDAKKTWISQPRLTRAEFVTMVAQSEQELRKRNTKFHFECIYVSYHTVTEHETDITPKLRKVLVTEKGNVEPKHRGILRQFHRVFAENDAIGGTCRALQKFGLNFSRGHMEGDYYTPVEPKLAATWKDASKLDGFGLSSPPTIVFMRKPDEPDNAVKPATKLEAREQATQKPESKSKGRSQ